MALNQSGDIFVGGRTDVVNNGVDYLTLKYSAVGAVAEGPTRDAPRSTLLATIVRDCLPLPDVVGGQRSAKRVAARCDRSSGHCAAFRVERCEWAGAGGVSFVRGSGVAGSRRIVIQK